MMRPAPAMIAARRRRSGQILVITLLAITLLVGLIFYVYNVGDQVNRRLEMQNAADAAAVSGGGWIARGMNVVALDNVTQARLMALALVLDSLPLAAEMTVAEAIGSESLREAVHQHLLGGVPSTPGDFLRRGLGEIYQSMGEHVPLVLAVDEALDQGDERSPEGVYDVAQASQWAYEDELGQTQPGTLWQATVAMDELSRATVASAGVLAQDSAIRFARASGAQAAMLVPVLPGIPAYRGRFEDFYPLFDSCVRNVNSRTFNRFEQRRVASDLVAELASSDDLAWDIERTGKTHWNVAGIFVPGGGTPDYAYPHRLGPFAGVYRWRDGAYLQSRTFGTTDFDRIWIGYETYGPLEHAIRTVLHGFGQMGWFPDEEGLAWSLRLPHHVRKIAKLKLAYLLGLPAPRRVQYSSRWIVDFQEAQDFARVSPEQVMSIRYYRVRVDSKIPWDSPRWMSGDSTDPDTRTWFSWQLDPPVMRPIEEQPLWRWAWDGSTRRYRWWEPSGTKVATGIWVDHRRLEVESYEYFNWLRRPRYDDEGHFAGYDLYTLYRTTWWVWGGLEVRDEVEISNPLAGASYGELPAPMLMDHAGEELREVTYADANGEVVEAVRVRPLELLAAAWTGATARVWPQQFRSHKPAEMHRNLALAQVKVFNNESWDLWTQDWQAQLTPIARWDDPAVRGERLGQWADTLNDAAGDAAETQGLVSEDDVEAIGRYLDNLDGDMIDEFLSH